MVGIKIKKEGKYCVNCGKELDKDGYCYDEECELNFRKVLKNK